MCVRVNELLQELFTGVWASYQGFTLLKKMSLHPPSTKHILTGDETLEAPLPVCLLRQGLMFSGWPQMRCVGKDNLELLVFCFHFLSLQVDACMVWGCGKCWAKGAPLYARHLSWYPPWHWPPLKNTRLWLPACYDMTSCFFFLLLVTRLHRYPRLFWVALITLLGRTAFAGL